MTTWQTLSGVIEPRYSYSQINRVGNCTVLCNVTSDYIVFLYDNKGLASSLALDKKRESKPGC